MKKNIFKKNHIKKNNYVPYSNKIYKINKKIQDLFNKLNEKYNLLNFYNEKEEKFLMLTILLTINFFFTPALVFAFSNINTSNEKNFVYLPGTVILFISLFILIISYAKKRDYENLYIKCKNEYFNLLDNLFLKYEKKGVSKNFLDILKHNIKNFYWNHNDLKKYIKILETEKNFYLNIINEIKNIEKKAVIKDEVCDITSKKLEEIENRIKKIDKIIAYYKIKKF